MRLTELKNSGGLQSKAKSHVAKLAIITGHRINYEDFKVLGQANSNQVLLYKDTLYKAKLKPAFDINLTSVPSNLFA